MDKFYSFEFENENELYHHGIKGQKWGIRNGPPYPLGSGKSPRVFINKYKNQSMGNIQDEWNKLPMPQKVSIVVSVAGVVVSVVSGAQKIYHEYKAEKDRDRQRKLEQEREARLREKENRLQEQHKKNMSKEELAGAVKKKLENMTNEELQDEIKRLRLESEYSRLNKDTESEASRYLKDTGKRVAQQVLASAVNLILQRYGPNALDALEEKADDMKTDRQIKKEEKSSHPSKEELHETARKQLERNPEHEAELASKRKSLDESNDYYRNEAIPTAKENLETAQKEVSRLKNAKKQHSNGNDSGYSDSYFEQKFSDGTTMYDRDLKKAENDVELLELSLKERESILKEQEERKRNLR